MKAVLDAGALVAVDKGDRGVLAMLRVLQRRRVPVWTSAAVVAQVWRNGARQAALARVLAGVGVRPLDGADGRRAGELQGKARASDVVDAHVAAMVDDGDHLLTSDPDDLDRLLRARAVAALVTRV